MFTEIKINENTSIYKSSINNIDNDSLIDDLKINCDLILTTSYPSEETPGIQSRIKLVSKNISKLRNEITNNMISFFNLDDDYLYFIDDWIFISENKNIYSGFHKHDDNAENILNFIKPQWTMVYYIQMPDNLKNNDGEIVFKTENDILFSFLPQKNDLLIFPADLLHRVETNQSSSISRIVYATNVAILDKKREYVKKSKTLL